MHMGIKHVNSSHQHTFLTRALSIFCETMTNKLKQ